MLRPLSLNPSYSANALSLALGACFALTQTRGIEASQKRGVHKHAVSQLVMKYPSRCCYGKGYEKDRKNKGKSMRERNYMSLNRTR